MSSILLTAALFLVSVCSPLTRSTAQQSPDVEYCAGEEFKPRCYQEDEVIVIRQASYGLVSRGRCLTIDYGPFCSTDVIMYVAGVCSGRRSCDVKVNDIGQLNETTHCQHSLSSYLNVSFSCLKVERRSCSSCSTSGEQRARVASSERGLLASIMTADTQNDLHCGSTHCPWSLQVAPGQVINLTLFDYTPPVVTSSRSSAVQQAAVYSSYSESVCTGPRLFVVKERANPRETVVCGGSVGGVRHAYTSISNTVELEVVSRDVIDYRRQFIIEFQAVGCVDVVAPRHTWMKRTDDHVEVGCPTTGQRWSLVCVGGKWQGELGKTCPGVPGVVIPGGPTAATGPSTDSGTTSFLDDFPFNVLLAGVVAVACIIGVFILTLGIVCIKRHQYKKRHLATSSRPNSIYARATSEFEFHGDMRPNVRPETMPMLAANSRPANTKPRLSTGRQFPDGIDPELQQQQQQGARRMIGSRPLPSIPPSSMDRQHPGMPGVQTTVQLHPNNTGSMHSACTCHSHPRGGYGPPGHYQYPTTAGYPMAMQYPVPSLAPKVRSIGTGPMADGGWGPPAASGAVYGNATLPYTDDQHHYFVLDPDVMPPPDRGPPSPIPCQTPSQPSSQAASLQRDTTEMRFPTPPPPLPEAQLTGCSSKATRQSPDGKERDEARDTSTTATDELKRRLSVDEIPLRPTRDGSQGKGVTLIEAGAVDASTMSSWP